MLSAISLSSWANDKGEATARAKENVLPQWAFGGFVRPEGVNPIITPIPENKFDCPMQKKPVGWEESDTFNAGTYSAGQVLSDKNDPYKVIGLSQFR